MTGYQKFFHENTHDYTHVIKLMSVHSCHEDPAAGESHREQPAAVCVAESGRGRTPPVYPP